MPRIFIYRGRCIFICKTRGVMSAFPEKPLHGSPMTAPFSRRCYSAFPHRGETRAVLYDIGIMTLYNRARAR